MSSADYLPRDTSRLLSNCLQQTIHIGAPLYNDGKIRDCYDIYMDAARYVLESSLTVQRSSVGQRLEQAVEEAIQVVRQTIIAAQGGADEAYDKGAWILRRCFDAILKDVSDSPSRSMTKNRQDSGVPATVVVPDSSSRSMKVKKKESRRASSIFVLPRDTMDSVRRSSNNTRGGDDYGVGVDYYSEAHFAHNNNEDTLQHTRSGQATADLAASLESIIDIRDRKHIFKTYSDCFVGRDAVDQIIAANSNKKMTRPQAIAQLSSLAQYGLIHHVTRAHIFKDKHLFYRFTSMQDIKKSINAMSLTLPTEHVLEGDDEEMIRFSALVHRYKHLISLDDNVESMLNKISGSTKGFSKESGGREVYNTPSLDEESTTLSIFNEGFSVLYAREEN